MPLTNSLLGFRVERRVDALNPTRKTLGTLSQCVHNDGQLVGTVAIQQRPRRRLAVTFRLRVVDATHAVCRKKNTYFALSVNMIATEMMRCTDYKQQSLETSTLAADLYNTQQNLLTELWSNTNKQNALKQSRKNATSVHIKQQQYGIILRNIIVVNNCNNNSIYTARICRKALRGQ